MQLQELVLSFFSLHYISKGSVSGDTALIVLGPHQNVAIKAPMGGPGILD